MAASVITNCCSLALLLACALLCYAPATLGETGNTCTLKAAEEKALVDWVISNGGTVSRYRHHLHTAFPA
jgi:hypothetical protein